MRISDDVWANWCVGRKSVDAISSRRARIDRWSLTIRLLKIRLSVLNSW